jgi:GH25 family lysozyme M1 (1,4-beta-N-acetylmuramidase)
MKHGIDVSYANNKINYAVARKYIDFAFIKHSEGNSIDKLCTQHTDGFGQYGVELGFYHFVRANEIDGILRANEYVREVKSPFPLILDFEGGDWRALKSTFDQCLKLPFDWYVYGQNWFLEGIARGVEAEAKTHPLWIGHYTVDLAEPKIPQPWRSWTAWQYRGDPFPKHNIPGGRVPGIEGAVDMNY